MFVFVTYYYKYLINLAGSSPVTECGPSPVLTSTLSGPCTCSQSHSHTVYLVSRVTCHSTCSAARAATTTWSRSSWAAARLQHCSTLQAASPGSSRARCEAGTRPTAWVLQHRARHQSAAAVSSTATRSPALPSDGARSGPRSRGTCHLSARSAGLRGRCGWSATCSAGGSLRCGDTECGLAAE